MEENNIYVFVSLKGTWVPAGLLKCSIENKEVIESQFRYGQKYLKRNDAFSIDLSGLPLTDDEFVTKDIFLGIKDSSPDSWGRALMERRAARPLREDEFLLASSDHRVGALSFSNHLSGPKRVTPWTDGQEDLDVIDLENVFSAYLKLTEGQQQELEQAMRQYILPGSPLGGARPKAVVRFENKVWIAKFQKENDPFDFVRCEHACMNLARRCGLDVPEVRIEKLFNRSIYLIERFDRTEDHRLHLNSFFSILQETELSFMHSSYMDISDALVKYSRKDQQDRLELFRRMIFNGLCRNTDDHLRNHAMIYHPSSQSYRLSPLYDVVSDLSAPTDFRLAIGCGLDAQGLTTREFSRKACLAAAHLFGLEKSQAEKIFSDMSRIVKNNWEHEFERSGFSPEGRHRFSTLFV